MHRSENLCCGQSCRRAPASHPSREPIAVRFAWEPAGSPERLRPTPEPESLARALSCLECPGKAEKSWAPSVGAAGANAPQRVSGREMPDHRPTKAAGEV
jgi:hypothetical protein